VPDRAHLFSLLHMSHASTGQGQGATATMTQSAPSSIPPFAIEKERYDQSRFVGRWQRAFEMTSPSNLLASDARITAALALLRNFQVRTTTPRCILRSPTPLGDINRMAASARRHLLSHTKPVSTTTVRGGEGWIHCHPSCPASGRVPPWRPRRGGPVSASVRWCIRAWQPLTNQLPIIVLSTASRNHGLGDLPGFMYLLGDESVERWENTIGRRMDVFVHDTGLAACQYLKFIISGGISHWIESEKAVGGVTGSS
jgi:hypothetical protein